MANFVNLEFIKQVRNGINFFSYEYCYIWEDNLIRKH